MDCAYTSITWYGPFLCPRSWRECLRLPRHDFCFYGACGGGACALQGWSSMVCGGAVTVPYWPGGEPTMSIATQLAGAALRLKAGPPLEQGWRSSYWSHLSTRVAQPAYGRDPTAVGHRDGDLSGTVNEWRLCSFCCRRWWTQQEQQPHNHRRHVSPWAAHRAASCSAPLGSFGSAGE